MHFENIEHSGTSAVWQSPEGVVQFPLVPSIALNVTLKIEECLKTETCNEPRTAPNSYETLENSVSCGFYLLMFECNTL